MPTGPDLRARVAALPWYHQIDLAPGVRTRGRPLLDALNRHRAVFHAWK